MRLGKMLVKIRNGLFDVFLPDSAFSRLRRCVVGVLFAKVNKEKENSGARVGDGVAFIGSDTTVDLKQSVYTAPENAIKVKVLIKPISKKHTVNNN